MLVMGNEYGWRIVVRGMSDRYQPWFKLVVHYEVDSEWRSENYKYFDNINSAFEWLYDLVDDSNTDWYEIVELPAGNDASVTRGE
jgi:hypothetical protein